MTCFGLDWANRTATFLCCRQCARIEWFLREPAARLAIGAAIRYLARRLKPSA